MTQTQIDILEIFAEAQAKGPHLSRLMRWAAQQEDRRKRQFKQKNEDDKVLYKLVRTHHVVAPMAPGACDRCGGVVELQRLRGGFSRPVHVGACVG